MSETLKVRAWHGNHNYFREASFAGDGVVPPLGLHRTHFPLPILMEAPPNMDNTDVLAWAFDFFNWLHLDFHAPDAVNEVAREHDSHASQSVGDIIEIEGVGWWMVKSVGWQKLAFADMYGRM